MSKLYENELKIAKDEELFHSDDDEAGNLLQTWNPRKRSMIPKGNPATYSWNKHIIEYVWTQNFVFVLEYEEDDDEENG